MRVLVVETRLPGVTNQVRGVARALQSRVPCTVVAAPVRLRKRLFRRIAAWCIDRGLIGPKRLGVLARLFYAGLPPDDTRPDVVITALGRSEYVDLLLGGADGAFTIHVGRPVYLPPERFDLLLIADDGPFEGGPTPVVRLPINPTPVLRADVDPARRPDAARLRAAADGRPLIALLVGGDGAGYRFGPADWDALARGAAHLASRLGACLLVTTSRRTGAEGERRLEAALSAAGAPVIEAVWYGRDPRPVVADHLAAADVVVCTEDSRSMIGDAVAAGRPVYTVRPGEAAPEPAHRAYVDAQAEAQRIRRVAAGALEGLDVDADRHGWFRSLEGCWSAPFLELLLATEGFRARLGGAEPRPGGAQ